MGEEAAGSKASVRHQHLGLALSATIMRSIREMTSSPAWSGSCDVRQCTRPCKHVQQFKQASVFRLVEEKCII